MATKTLSGGGRSYDSGYHHTCSSGILLCLCDPPLYEKQEESKKRLRRLFRLPGQLSGKGQKKLLQSGKYRKVGGVVMTDAVILVILVIALIFGEVGS